MQTRSEFTKKLRAVLLQQLADPDLNGEQLALGLNMSRMHLHRHLQRYYQQPAGRVIAQARLNRACELLTDSTLSINKIATLVGFRDPSYFARVFRQKYGSSPREFRREQEAGQ